MKACSVLYFLEANGVAGLHLQLIRWLVQKCVAGEFALAITGIEPSEFSWVDTLW
jgi:hypothetical protein